MTKPPVTLGQAGLTLVELMVALTLGLFLTLGLVLMMSDSSRTFKIQDDYARMQENAVSGLRAISDSLRHTGFYGLIGTTIALDNFGTIGAITNDCGDTFRTDIPLFGYNDQAAPPVGCINAANFSGPSDVLIARLGRGLEVRDPNNDGNYADGMVLEHAFTNTLYVQSDANMGFVFRGGDFGTLVSSEMVKRYANGRQFPVFPYQMHVYYLRPCSRPTGAGGTCVASDDGGRPIPTLVRQELQGTAMVERALAEGVERVSFMYGVDTLPAEGDGVADRFYANPLDAGADGWTRVVAVRVTLLVRTPTIISGYDDSAKNYDLNGDGTTDFNCGAAFSEPCTYKRSVFSQLIHLRNVAFRRGA